MAVAFYLEVAMDNVTAVAVMNCRQELLEHALGMLLRKVAQPDDVLEELACKQATVS